MKRRAGALRRLLTQGLLSVSNSNVTVVRSSRCNSNVTSALAKRALNTDRGVHDVY
jgi:hypothetical protein